MARQPISGRITMIIEQPVTTNIGRQAGGSVANLRVHRIEITTDKELIEPVHPLVLLVPAISVCTPCATDAEVAGSRVVWNFGRYDDCGSNDWEQTFHIGGKKVAALGIR